jgi:hypothetical protein
MEQKGASRRWKAIKRFGPLCGFLCGGRLRHKIVAQADDEGSIRWFPWGFRFNSSPNWVHGGPREHHLDGWKINYNEWHEERNSKERETLKFWNAVGEILSKSIHSFLEKFLIRVWDK